MDAQRNKTQKEKIQKQKIEAYKKHIGSSVRAARRARAMTLADMAELLACSAEQVRKYEIAATPLSAARLCLVAERLQLPVRTFLPLNIS